MDVPAVVGCPLITPVAGVEAEALGQAGGRPDVRARSPGHRQGAEYGWLTVPEGRDAVLIPNVLALTVRVRVAVACCGAGVRTVLPAVLAHGGGDGRVGGREVTVLVPAAWACR